MNSTHLNPLRRTVTFTAFLVAALISHAAETPPGMMSAADKKIRDRYQQVLLRNAFQQRAFDQVYEGYLVNEGVEKWVEQLEPKTEGDAPDKNALLVLGQILDRQFKTAEAIETLEKAGKQGEDSAKYKLLLGSLYYKDGQDTKAAGLLSESLDSLSDLDQRSQVCRVLGNLYLRQGKRAEAIEVWKRITEQNPTEVFSQLELAEIYEDNRMWAEAIAVYENIGKLSESDPYRRCRSLRSVGDCQLRIEKHTDAIASYEKALELVAPGNWLFEDLKLRLVGVYQDIGDLDGLVKYIQAKLKEAPNDLEFRDLLSETYVRMTKLDAAETELKFILERRPNDAGVYEKLIALYDRAGKQAERVAALEKLIELFPRETDYVRRLGEVHLAEGDPAKAKETWGRIAKDDSPAERWAELAEWLESYEFPDEAIGAYDEALKRNKNNDWIYAVAGLRFAKGDEETATKLWLSIIDPEKSSAEEIAEVAKVLELNNQKDKASGLLKTAVEKSPKNYEVRNAYAANLMLREEYEDAVTQFEALIAQDENEFLKERGERGRLNAYAKLGVLADKQKEWEEALAKDPKSDAKLLQLARLYERANKRPQALALYKRRIEAAPENLGALRDLAEAYKDARRIDDAIETWNTLVEKDKNRSRVYYQSLLDVHLSYDQKDQAIATAEKIVSLAPADPEARLDLAQVLGLYQETERSLQEYRNALRLDPNEPDYHRQYGDALSQQQKWGEAQEAFRNMLEAASEDATRLTAVGRLAGIHLAQNRLDELVSEFSRRVRNTPKKLSAYEELAAIYDQSGQPDRSMETLEAALENVTQKEPALQQLIRSAFDMEDFDKARNYYEQLIATSGEPSSQELERLGKIYYQQGDTEKAKETWGRILDTDPNDVSAIHRVAKIYQDSGLQDEAMDLKAQAVEKKPYDYVKRYEYAYMLYRAGKREDALAQAQKILELGEGPEAEEQKKTSEKQVRRRTRGQSARYPSYMFRPGTSFRPRFSSRLYGKLEDNRETVVGFMVNVARNNIGEGGLLEYFEKRVKDHPDDPNPKKDLLAAHFAMNRVDDAFKLAGEILEESDSDTTIVQQIAALHASRNEYDKAIGLYAKLAEKNPGQRVAAWTQLATLHAMKNEDEKVSEYVEKALALGSNNYAVVYGAASAYQRNRKFDKAIELYERAIEADPKLAQNLRQSIAMMKGQAGDKEAALAFHRQTLTNMLSAKFAVQGAPVFINPSSRRTSIYIPTVPRVGSASRIFYGPGYLPSNVMNMRHYTENQALTEVRKSAKDGDAASAELVKQMRERAVGYSPTASVMRRKQDWSIAHLMLYNDIATKEYDSALKLMEKLNEAEVKETDLHNAYLYVLQQQEKYGEMLTEYERLQKLLPRKTRELIQAKIAVSFLNEDLKAVAKHLNELQQHRVAPKVLMASIAPLEQRGETKLAMDALNNLLARGGRNTEALSMLARLHAGESDFDKAIDVATEVWERGAATTSSYSYYSGRPYLSSSSSRTSVSLRDLHGYYSNAGREDELVKKLEERLAKQPGSVRRHEELAELYTMVRRRDDAIEVYKSLLKKQPNSRNAKISLAQQYERKGDYAEALKIYEAIIEVNPSMLNNLSWSIRNIYQRMGKTKEIAKIDNKLMKQARSADDFLNLGRNLQRSGKHEEAVKMFSKALELEPGRGYYMSYMTRSLEAMGKPDKAAKIYMDQLFGPNATGQGYIDHNAIKSMIRFSKSAKMLDEVRGKTEAVLKNDKKHLYALAINAHLNIADRKYQPAWDQFATNLKDGSDPNILRELAELAKTMGKPNALVDLIEKEGHEPREHEYYYLVEPYLDAGRPEKAYEAAVKQIEWNGQHSSSLEHYVRMGFDQLAAGEAWDQAEKLLAKYKSVRPRSPSSYRSMYDTIANAHVEEGKFTTYVNDVLAREKIGPTELEFIKALAGKYGKAGQKKKQIEMLDKLLASKPKDDRLKFEIAKQQIEAGQTDAGLKRMQEVADANPKQRHFRDDWASAMINAGREDEMFDHMIPTYADIKYEPRLTSLAKLLRTAGRYRDSVEITRKAIQLARGGAKSTAEGMLGGLLARNGQPEEGRALLRKRFDSRGNESAFGSYFNFLAERGWGADARKFYLEHREKGLAPIHQYREIVRLLLQEGDVDESAELAWRALNDPNASNRQRYFTEIAKIFDEKGKTPALFARINERLRPDDSVSTEIKTFWAQTLANKGYAVEARDILKAEFVNVPDTLLKLIGDIELALGNEDAAIDAFREIAENAGDARAEAAARADLIDRFARFGRKEEAAKLTAEMAEWVTDAPGHHYLGQAYTDLNNYEKAAEHFRKSIELDPKYNTYHPASNLGRSLVMSGKIDEAVDVWEKAAKDMPKQRARLLGNVRGWLKSRRDLDVMIEIAEKMTERGLSNVEHQSLIANAWFRKGEYDKAYAALQFGHDKAKNAGERNLAIRTTALYSIDKGLVDELLKRAEASHDSIMALAVGVALGDLAKSGRFEEAKKLTPFSKNIVSDSKAVLLPLAQGLAAIGEEHEAKVRYSQALLILKGTEREAAAAEAARMGVTEAVITALEKTLKGSPLKFQKDVNLIEAYARAGTPEQVDAMVERLSLRFLTESQGDCLKTLAAWYQSGEKEGLDKLVEFADVEGLNMLQLQRLGEIAQANEKYEAAEKLFGRLASGGYGKFKRWTAIKNLAEIQAAKGDIGEAVRSFASIYNWRSSGVGTAAKNAILNAATASNLDQVREAIVGLVSADPGNDRNSYLLGLYSQLATKLGSSTDAATLAKELKVSESELAEAVAWDNLIEDWKVAGPYPCRGSARMAAPQPVEQRLLKSGSSDKEEWKQIDPKDSLGFVDIAKTFGMQHDHASEKVAYAVGSLESDSDRIAKLSLGSDDWSKVWVNGREVFKRTADGAAFRGQHVFPAKLKKGSNQIIVKIGNNAGGWRFSLGEMAMADTMKVASEK